MRDHNSVQGNFWSSRHVSNSLQGHINYPVVAPEVSCYIKIQEWSMSTSNPRNPPFHTRDGLDWRFNVGIVRHDNIPLFWNSELECWCPLEESSLSPVSISEGTVTTDRPGQ